MRVTIDGATRRLESIGTLAPQPRMSGGGERQVRMTRD